MRWEAACAIRSWHGGPEDWDITTSARPEEIKKLFRRTVDTGIEHGTVNGPAGKGQL